MTSTSKMRLSAGLAVLTGLMLRLFFILKFPVQDSGDAPFYIELAWNWLKNGVYGFPIAGHLTPVDMRVPGYPAFLAAVFAVFRAIDAGSDACAGGRRSRDLLSGGTDRGPTGAGIVPATRGAGGIVARGALPFHGKLHGRRSDRNARHLPDRSGDSGVSRSVCHFPALGR